MNQPLLQSDSLAISHRSDLAMLAVRWLNDAATAELRSQYDHVLTMVQQTGVAHLLLDVRRRTAPTPETSQWVTDEWLPRIVAALAPRQPCLAYLVSPMRAEVLANQPAARFPVGNYLADASSGFCLETFIDEGEAVRWLQAQ